MEGVRLLTRPDWITEKHPEEVRSEDGRLLMVSGVIHVARVRSRVLTRQGERIIFSPYSLVCLKWIRFTARTGCREIREIRTPGNS